MSGTGADFSAEYKTWLRSFWDTQTQVYEGSGQGRHQKKSVAYVTGWVFWAWKTEQAAEWSYQAGVAGGWIPSNPSQHVSTLSELCV
jgi:glucan 1,3-beta-glucosidase